jgi:hypothetical protein
VASFDSRSGIPIFILISETRPKITSFRTVRIRAALRHTVIYHVVNIAIVLTFNRDTPSAKAGYPLIVVFVVFVFFSLFVRVEVFLIIINTNIIIAIRI